MKRLGWLCLLLSLSAQADHAVRAEFDPIAFVVGSCWEGDFDGQGMVDRHCFTQVFGGVHIRDTHQVTGGPQLYSGETIYSWNGDDNEIQFVYWNSIGGVSQGSAQPDGDRIVFPDESYTGADGTQVTVQTYWRRDGDDAYESIVVESYQNGESRERRVRYQRVGPASHH